MLTRDIWISSRFSSPQINRYFLRVEVPDECITAFRDLIYKRGASKPAFVIYKISDDKTSILVEESSTDKNYETFLQRLTSSVDADGKPAPRYAVYDVEYDLKSDGKR